MKTKLLYRCGECGATSLKWAGRCPGCGAWNTLTEEVVQSEKRSASHRSKAPEITPLKGLSALEESRITTGISELDRVLGGGFVKGEVVLLGGEPGVGKSTLLLQAAEKLASQGHKVLYASGEESSSQIKMRADRLELPGENIFLLSTNSAEEILESLDSQEYAVLIVDSIQTVAYEGLDTGAGSVVQIRAVASGLIEKAKTTGLIVVLVGHITKGGELAGPKVLEHLVDAVLYFEGDRFHQGRILRAIKNRFGASFEVGLFEISGHGLMPVENPFSLWESEERSQETGVAILPAIEGARPLLVEIQALVTPSPFMGNPRRIFLGVDRNRGSMLIAVMEKRLGVKFFQDDIFVKVSGGLSLQDPAIDLAMAAALLSSKTGVRAKNNAVFLGEVSLSGEVRPPYLLTPRLKEAVKFGFPLIVTAPSPDLILPEGARIDRIKTLTGLRSYFHKRTEP